jgi:S-adenosylmethionine:tRNA ribosyltransferase-isomerase
MLVSDFDYFLPAELIAQHPAHRRDASRMLVLERADGYADQLFGELPEILQGDELLVVNNVRVIPARLFGRRTAAGGEGRQAIADAAGEVEVLLSRRLDETTWETLARPGRKVRVGQRVVFGGGELEAEVVGHGDSGERTLRFAAAANSTVDEQIERLGHMPLPPYIERADEPADRQRYQTIFAKDGMAIAAPTAGLHFTPDIVERIRARGVEVCELTLHVGLGTFQPVRSETLEAHEMHSEKYEISSAVAEAIEGAKRRGRRILAVGTTTVRALESAALRAREMKLERLIAPEVADTRLLIAPGFEFRVVDALLTNFHLPRSTLLALVAAFAERERILDAYRHAVEARYRFYSYGDCMLIR